MSEPISLSAVRDALLKKGSVEGLYEALERHYYRAVALYACIRDKLPEARGQLDLNKEVVEFLRSLSPRPLQQ